MKVYIYDTFNFEYLCEHECLTDPSSSEFVKPNNSTEEVPLIPSEGNAVVFDKNNAKWKLVNDYRNKIFYDKRTGEEQERLKLGQEPSAFWTDLKPTGSVWNNEENKWIPKEESSFENKLEFCKNKRQIAFEKESDPIFFQVQREELKEGTTIKWALIDWQNKVAEIKSRFPKPEK